jgi:8-oxo-dGTP pyrophosphatase MutT (NUDIX family)
MTDRTPGNPPEILVRAAGGVIWRRRGDRVETAVVHRPRYDDWTLPKGKLDDGETLEDCARREILEETGIAVELGEHVCTTRYPVTAKGGRHATKVVDYWLARPVDVPVFTSNDESVFVPNDEVDELRWCDAADAAALLSYARDREVLDAAMAMLDG